MTRISWDQVGRRFYETGVDRGVLFIPNQYGAYTSGFAWNGLVSVTESPSGAESNPQYADNTKYLNLVSTEELKATVEAYTYPDEFAQCDGTATPEPGVLVGQQRRVPFGLAYRTRFGNDVSGTDYGYKLHLVYGCLAAPSERAYSTINDSPEALTFSWEVTTTPVEIGTVGGVAYKPTSLMVLDSTKVNATTLAALEDLIYGTAGADPSLPLPAAVIAMFSGTVTEVTPTTPSYNSSTKVITIPTVTGIEYLIDGVVVTGSVTITADKIVTARPLAGYKFPSVIDDDWLYEF